jgi:hypothetical protein
LLAWFPIDLAFTLALVAFGHAIPCAKHDDDRANDEGFPDDIEEEMHM